LRADFGTSIQAREAKFKGRDYLYLFSSFLIPKARVVVEGSPITRINKGQNIFYIHGVVKRPDSIVASFNDYYQFINSRNSFSRKTLHFIAGKYFCYNGLFVG